MEAKEIKTRLVRFANKHGWAKNPIRDFDWLAKRLSETNGACPCKPKERPVCPCREAANEIKSRGYCMCFEFLHPNYNYKSGIFDK